MPTGRWIGKVALVAVLAPTWGCAHGPRSFKKVESPAPLVRARAVGLGKRQADAKVIPALVSHLNDPDPVVRLAAHEELRRRTGRDFGYEPWDSPEERAVAVSRWRDWMVHGDGIPQPVVSTSIPPPVTKVPPGSLAPASLP